MEYSDEVKKLAETLKSSGLAASMKDALDRAQSMIGEKEEEKEEPKEEPLEEEIDAAQTTLGDVKEPKEKKEVEESPELDGGLKKEEVFTDKADSAQKEEKQKGLGNEKKVDLTEVFNVNK